MKETKHTLGPWSYEGGDNASCEVNAGRTTISIPRWDKNTGVHVIDRDEMEANGKLIAAAPDLLNELETALDEIRECYSQIGADRDSDITMSIERTIKKATL